MKKPIEALNAVQRAMSYIDEECCSVLGSEQHYQAMVYHALRLYGKVPISQLGMNVKIWISQPETVLFKELDLRKDPAYQGGFEPIPDVVIFSPKIKGDWRRRNRENTLSQMLLAMEIKASERDKGHLTAGEVIKDLKKLHALREEAARVDGALVPIVAMLVIDSARDEAERMTSNAVEQIQAEALAMNVVLFYVSACEELVAVVPPLNRAILA